jgi:hypothetical protein
LIKEPESKSNTEEIEMESIVDGTKNLKFQNEETEPPAEFMSPTVPPVTQNSQKELNPSIESKNVEKSFISQTKTQPRFQKPKPISFPKVDLKRSPPQRTPIVEKKTSPIQKIETKKSPPKISEIEPKRMREEDFSQQNSEKRRKIDFDELQIEEVNSFIPTLI